jgi:hypothetical protein
MKRAAFQHRRSNWQYVAWLPVVVLFAIIATLAAPALLSAISPRQPASVSRNTIELDRWTLSAAVSSLSFQAFSVDVELVAKDQENMVPPPWPVISAFMRGHSMTEWPRMRALGPTSFQAVFEPAMAGAWTVEIEAEGNSLQIPITVR